MQYKPEILEILTSRILELEKRERIVLSFPYGSKLNRIEFYMSETETNTSGAGQFISGKPFPYIVTMQVYKDNSNKHTEKSSYSYKKELVEYLPILFEKLNNIFK